MRARRSFRSEIACSGTCRRKGSGLIPVSTKFRIFLVNVIKCTPIPQFSSDPRRPPGGRDKDIVDKRKAWREQEQQLIEKWNSAAQRYRDIMARIAREDPFAAPDGPSEEIMSQAAAVRAEIEALRKKVARLKAEFNSGKRY